jgi:hypothetical protein
MAKSFKKFREEWEDDEWGTSEDDHRRKERRMENRRNKRRDKIQEKFASFDDVDTE